jgi:thiol-disulfide isomerase/thioredoxin
MSRSGRWTLVGVVIIGVLIAAFLYQLRDVGSEVANSGSARVGSSLSSANTSEALAVLRKAANLPPCPVLADVLQNSKLKDVRVSCASDGASVDAARMVGGGRPVVMNLWAYWCKPCGDELPAMAEYQRIAGDTVTVVTVHQDQNEAAGLGRLADLEVRLPTVQDGRRQIAAALGVPNVMPATVVFRLDGSVAKIIPQAFTSSAEIAAAVTAALR